MAKIKRAPYTGKPRFFDHLPKAEKKKVIARLIWLNRMKKFRPYKSSVRYNRFFHYAAINTSESYRKLEFLNLGEFELFYDQMYSNKSTAEKLELLKNYSNNDVIDMFIKCLYDPYTFHFFNRNYFSIKKVRKSDLQPKRFLPQYKMLCDYFMKKNYHTYSTRRLILTYWFFYRRWKERAMYLLTQTDGFICCSRSLINEAVGKDLISKFEIRSHKKVDNKHLLKTLGNETDYFVSKRPLGIPAYWIFDATGKQHLYCKSNLKDDFIVLSKSYEPLVFDKIKLDLNKIVFEVIVSSLDTDGKTREITGQYLNNKRKIKLFKLDNIQIGIYDVFTLDEYISGTTKLNYSQRLENLKNIFEYYTFDNIKILETTKIKDLDHLLAIAEFAQKRDGEDLWDGLQFIKDEPFSRTGEIIDLYTRTSEPRKHAQYRKDRAGLQNK